MISLQKKLNIDVSRQRIPDWIYKEFTLQELPYYFLHKFEQGYDFWFDGFYVFHPEYIPPNGDTILLELQVEFVRDIRSRTLQNDKYNVRLVTSTPSGGPVIAPQTELAIPRVTYLRYNEPYVNAETLKARFTWRVIPAVPVQVKVLMFGYKIPENSLDMWR